MVDTREYIEEQYRLAVLDFKVAQTEEEQWKARKDLAKLELVASQTYGFDYADMLHDKYIPVP